MSTVIVVSDTDLAGKNIAAHLIENHGFEDSGEYFEGFKVFQRNKSKMVFLKESQVFADHLNDFFDPDLFVFASRHASESGRPSFCVHAPGNFGEAKFGGRDKELAFSDALFQRHAFSKLLSLDQKDFEVALEATHHGPTALKKPCVFVELGSTEHDWKRIDGGAMVAGVISESVDDFESNAISKFPVALGFGGPHYCPLLARKEMEEEFALSHIVPKWAAQDVDFEMVKQAVEKTRQKVEFAAFDSKGLRSTERKTIEQALEKLSIEWTRY
ncbi:MAG: hypothetical protein J7K00_02605 [Candidatus Diapherotrites archaeon]|nr:hypothetical protein [Candidatus Diapherotrites archaeon]